MWIVIAIGVVAFALVSILSKRGRDSALEDYQSRRDDAKAERLIAQVRQELSAQKPDLSKPD